ncbi:MAG: ATP-binding domain-containing protein [Bacteroidetes bacterium]|nr:MAG: ATP-binding domain-containing protein [Bacteroidota bacterium]
MISRSLIIIFLLTSLIGFAQRQKTIDSITNQLAVSKSDTSRISIMLSLAAQYTYAKPDSALLYVEKAINLIQNKKADKWKPTALRLHGSINREIGNLPLAIELTLNSLRIGQKYNNNSEIRRSYNGLGNIYLDLMDYQKSISFFQLSRQVPDITKTEFSEMNLLLNIGNVYTESNQLDSASYYLNKAFHLFIRSGSGNSGIFMYRNLGKLKVKLGNQKQALNYYLKSIEACGQEDYRNLAATNNKIAVLFLTDRQADSCIYYAEKALKYGIKGPFRVMILESSKLLAEAYKSKDDFRKALEYQELMVDTKEKLYGAGNIEAIQAMVYQEQKRNDEIEASKLAYQNRLKQYGYLAGVGLLIIIAMFLYRNNKQKNKANTLLQEQKEKAEDALSKLKSTQSQLIQSEKMASLGELTAGIAHEIQNPLNFVNNFSEVNMELIAELKEELEAGNLEDIKAIADDIAINEEKILEHGKRADAIVKGMLQHSRSSSGVKEPTDINALADEYLRLSYHGLRAKDKSFNADFKTEFDVSLPEINIIPQDIGRVLLNLINNAFYVVAERQRNLTGLINLSDFDSHYEPTVTVSTKNLGESIEISVKDNGNGIPDEIKNKIFQPFFTTKPTGQGTGLGLSLSYDIVKAHGGELKVETKDGVGSEFIIQLPVV